MPEAAGMSKGRVREAHAFIEAHRKQHGVQALCPDPRGGAEREGILHEVQDVRIDERNLRVAVKTIASALGDDVSEESRFSTHACQNGSRVAAVFPPCSVGGTSLALSNPLSTRRRHAVSRGVPWAAPSAVRAHS
jgi:hypothetical protein